MDFPQGTEDLYQHLGAHEDSQNAHSGTGADHQADHGGDASARDSFSVYSPADIPASADEPANLIEHDKETNTIKVSVSNLPIGRFIKAGIPYVVIFAVSVFFFLIFFTNFSVKSLFNSATAPAEAAMQKKNYPNMDAYNAWINSYFFQVNDPKILDPDYDISGNGLTNYQKFVLGLNPKRADTLGIGMSDSQALLAGINPLTGGPLTDNEKKIVAQYVDLEALSNKLTLAAADSAGRVAGASTDQRSVVSIDTAVPGEVNIPSLNIKVPLIWTSDPKNFERDLQSGVVHYPGTALPGQIGTAYISGHSSNYSWAKGSYNKVFDTLGNLKQYDSFAITVTDTSGKKIIFHYVVTGSQVYQADDQAQFASKGKSVAALSTCWPIGTSAQRLVVFGELTQTDK